MWKEDEFDEMLRKEMHLAADQESASDLGRARVMARVMENTQKKGGYHMRRLPKAAMITAACLVLGGVGVYAAGAITGTFVSSNNVYDYTSYDDLEKAEEKTGYQVDAPETLPGGFSFDGVTLVDIADTDDDQNQYNNRTGMDITYKNDAGEKINLGTDNVAEDTAKTPSYQEKKETDNGTLYYSKVEHLFVPADYQPTTEEAERNENDPFFSIGYGSDEKETSYSSSVFFTKDNVSYILYGMDVDLTADDMLAMAEEIID